MYYNVRYAKAHITVVEGDTIDMTFDVEMNDEAHDMTGMQLDMHIKDETTGATVREMSTAGVDPELTISTSSFIIQSDTPFDTEAVYDYDVQETDSGSIFTIMKGKLYVVKEITITY